MTDSERVRRGLRIFVGCLGLGIGVAAITAAILWATLGQFPPVSFFAGVILFWWLGAPLGLWALDKLLKSLGGSD